MQYSTTCRIVVSLKHYSLQEKNCTNSNKVSHEAERRNEIQLIASLIILHICFRVLSQTFESHYARRNFTSILDLESLKKGT